ncbi:hypothetical protein FA95DRAFT_1682001, partial [Auriscalpium vulgare]
MVVLPRDVHVEIIDWVYRNSQHIKVDYRTISACSLVCKTWTTPAQRLLFRCIWPRDMTAVLRTLDQLLPVLQQNHILGTYVRNTSVFLGSPNTIRTENFLALLTLCPNVTSLYITAISHLSTSSNLDRYRLRALQLRI